MYLNFEVIEIKRIFIYVKNLKISFKFTAAFFMILSIQTLITGIYLYMQASNSAISQAKNVMEQNLMQTKSSILQKQNIIENIAPIITDDKNIKNFFDKEYENDYDQLKDYQFNFAPILENVLAENNTISSLKIYMDNAMFAERRNSFFSINKNTSPNLYEDMLKSKPKKDGWTSTHNSYNENIGSIDQVFSYSSPIVSIKSLRKVGELEIEVKENVLFDMLRDPIISKFGKIVIVDKSNKIVSNNYSELYQKNISVEGIKNYSVFKQANTVMMVNHVKSIFISVPINEMDCSIVGIFPISNFNGTVKNSVTNITIFLLITAILTGIMIFLTTKLLLGRIKKLVKAMKQVREGTLDVSVKVDSLDEFGELGVSFNHMTQRIHELVETVYKIQIMEREAELKALEAQINPHFLYNTLATISWVARKNDSSEVIKITNSLAKFYRLVLSKGKTLISVKDEIDIVASYLYIQKTRFEDTINIVYSIDEEIYKYNIIKNILQPIVENAITHGIGNKRGNSTIIIKAGFKEEKIYFRIIDDGVGMSKKTSREVLSGEMERTNGSGYAIKNIIDRLKAYYGEDQSFEIYSRTGIGTEITITLSRHLEHKFNNRYTYLKR